MSESARLSPPLQRGNGAKGGSSRKEVTQSDVQAGAKLRPMRATCYACVGAAVGRWSLHVVDSTSGGAAAAASGKRKRGARLNYLSLPSVEGEHDFRISIKELLLSVIYENLQRCARWSWAGTAPFCL